MSQDEAVVPKKDSPRTQLLGAVAALALRVPAVYVNSWAMSHLWDWFLRPQYGAGPGMAAWYGINCLCVLMIGPLFAGVSMEKDWLVVSKVLARAVALPLVVVITLYCSYLLGLLLGWV